MVTVYSVKSHHAGFGMYQKDAEGVDFPGLDTVEEYRNYVQQENTSLEPIIDTDDEWEQVEDADGKTYNQNGGTIIGWKEGDGTVTLECVHVS